jgi:mannose-1-phosphate guanylyltransferase
VRAIVLVGGEGTRMRPLTYTTPKPLLPVCNQAFVDHQLAWLAAHGVDEVVLSLGYLPDAFVAHFPEGRYAGVDLRYAVEAEPLGTAGAIRFAAGDQHERFVVCNGDVLTDLDLGALVREHEKSGAEATIALTRVDDPSRFGVVPTDPDGRVLAFVEKPEPGRAPTDWINAGTYVLEPSMLDRIPQGVNTSIERVTFPRMLESGGRLYARRSDAYWLDVGIPAQYVQAHLDLLAGLVGGMTPPGAHEIAPGVWASGEVELHPDAVIAGPVLFGAGVRVAPGATVRRSSLGEGASVASGAVVDASVVLAGAALETGARVVDSILGPGSTVGRSASVSELSVVGAGAAVEAGATLAGVRIDPAGHRA